MNDLTPKQRRQKASAQRRLHNVMLAGIILLMVAVFAIANLCTKSREFSDTENRSLAQPPAFSLGALADGSFFSGLTDAYNDQFFARDNWMSMKLREDALLGRKESSGVYLCENGYLIGAPDTPNEQAVQKTAAAISEFAAKYSDIPMYTMVVPGASVILKDYLPKNAPVRDQQLDIAQATALIGDGVRHIDVSGILSAHASEYIYYKTDHHWTSLGAQHAFEAASGTLGLQSALTYDIYTVTTQFEGTLASKSGSHGQLDSIQIYALQGTDLEYYVNYVDTQEKVCSIFRSECLEQKDKYTVFFGGNFPLLEIHTTANTGRNLLLFKDSYANSFVQFLLPYYDNITMIDPRYYYDNVDMIMNSSGITEVLFLYSADTFLTDTALTDVLTAGTAQEDPEAPADRQAAAVPSPVSPSPVPADSAMEPEVDASTADEPGIAEPNTASGGGTIQPPVAADAPDATADGA